MTLARMPAACVPGPAPPLGVVAAVTVVMSAGRGRRCCLKKGDPWFKAGRVSGRGLQVELVQGQSLRKERLAREAFVALAPWRASPPVRRRDGLL